MQYGNIAGGKSKVPTFKQHEVCRLHCSRLQSSFPSSVSPLCQRHLASGEGGEKTGLNRRTQGFTRKPSVFGGQKSENIISYLNFLTIVQTFSILSFSVPYERYLMNFFCRLHYEILGSYLQQPFCSNRQHFIAMQYQVNIGKWWTCWYLCLV